MILNAAPLIHSRTKFVDYRSGFLVRPKDFDSTFTKSIRKYILSSTSSIEELGRDECRRIVISKGGSVILGLTAYIAYFNQISGGIFNDMLCDESRKHGIFLFAGLVIKRNDIRGCVKFPTDSNFVEIIQQYLAPRWNDYKYDEASLEATLAEYEVSVEFENATVVDRQLSVNSTSNDMVKLFSSQNDMAVLNSVLSKLPNSKDVSICTNMSYVSDAKESVFMNITIKNLPKERTEKNCLFKEATTTSQAGDINQKELTVKKAENKPSNVRNIAISLLCIGAIVICGIYIIIVDKNTVLNILILAGISLAALICEIILIHRGRTQRSNTYKSQEKKIESDFVIDIKNKSNFKNENSDDIFKL